MESTVQLQAAGDIINYRPHAGVLQGDSPSAQLFLEAYHPQLDVWHNECCSMPDGHALDATCFLFNNDVCNLSMSTYADDVARITVCKSAQDCAQKVADINASLDTALENITLAQNQSKQEHVVFFGGAGSKANNEAIYAHSSLPGHTRLSARYLGGQQHYTGQHHDEISMRLRKAQQSWLRMGSFWFRAPVQTRGKLVIYQGVVYNTLLSGLESLVLDTKHLSLLDRKVLVHGRKLMGGKACQKEMQADGTVKFIACHSNTVWKFLGLVPSSIELRIRRLRWYQNLASNMELHKSVVVAMFGRLDCETQLGIPVTMGQDGKIHEKANAWAKQFKNDILGLKVLDAGAQLLEYIGDCVGLVFTTFREEFLYINVTAMRATFLPNQIPPPDWHPPVEPLHAEPSVDDEPPDLPFVCLCVLHDGTVCNKAFATPSALAIHKTNTKGGTHGYLSDVSKVAVANICPWCRQVYHTIQSAKEHIRRKLRTGQCTGRGSAVVYQVVPPSQLCCPTCDVVFGSVDELLAHVVSHVQLPVA